MSMSAGINRRGFTLIEIMVSLMIFIVVSGAMVGIMLMSSELFRRGEFSRAANDEVVAVLGAVSDDLNHLVPETGDGWFFAGVPTASGNTLVAYTTAGQNPDGIGAQVRLQFGQRGGPIREIHAGSGYWSQDSIIMVFGVLEAPTRIWVRWPGGKVVETVDPDNAKEVSVTIEEK